MEDIDIYRCETEGCQSEGTFCPESCSKVFCNDCWNKYETEHIDSGNCLNGYLQRHLPFYSTHLHWSFNREYVIFESFIDFDNINPALILNENVFVRNIKDLMTDYECDHVTDMINLSWKNKKMNQGLVVFSYRVVKYMGKKEVKGPSCPNIMVSFIGNDELDRLLEPSIDRAFRRLYHAIDRF